MASTKARWGLLSTARINERLIPCIRASARSELAAVASRDAERARQYADEWQIPKAQASYEALLADPGVDVVYLSLPNSLHAEWGVKCAEAGKHVLCEKPLALTADEVDRMAAAADRNGVVLQEACMMRYHRQTDDVRRLVAEGAIGDVRLIRSVFTFTLARDGDIRLDPALGGGALWDLGSYQVSFAQAALQQDPVEVVAWQVASAARGARPAGVDLSFSGQLRYPSGTLVQFFCSFQSAPAADAELVGTAGLMRLDQPYQNHPGSASHIRLSRERGATSAATFSDSADGLVEEALTYEAPNAYQDQVEAMVACVLDGTPPRLPVAQSRANITTIAALLESARTGRPVSLG